MTIYKPYTYLIGWSQLGKYYYGVRYAKNCHPDDLWQSYFTSSKNVKKFAAKHGNPDLIIIRRTFESANSAMIWENKVLKRLDARNHPKMLNATNNMANTHPINYNPAKNLGKFIVPNISRGTWEELYGEEKAASMRENHSKVFKGNKYGAFKRSEETKEKMSKAAYKRWSDPTFKRKMSYKWITNGNKTVRIAVNDILPVGWYYGRS